MSVWLRSLTFLLVLGMSMSTRADERVSVCYNYDCAAETTVRFTEAQLALLKRKLAAARSPGLERQILASVVGRMYAWAGQQSLISEDQPGNLADEARPGSMDCLDHSANTTRFMKVLQKRGALRYHWVEEVERRSRMLIFTHFAATIRERRPSWLPGHALKADSSDDDEYRDRYVVDSWFVKIGEPAVVLPLREWMDGGGPDVD